MRVLRKRATVACCGFVCTWLACRVLIAASRRPEGGVCDWYVLKTSASPPTANRLQRLFTGRCKARRPSRPGLRVTLQIQVKEDPAQAPGPARAGATLRMAPPLRPAPPAPSDVSQPSPGVNSNTRQPRSGSLAKPLIKARLCASHNSSCLWRGGSQNQRPRTETVLRCRGRTPSCRRWCRVGTPRPPRRRPARSGRSHHGARSPSRLFVGTSCPRKCT